MWKSGFLFGVVYRIFRKIRPDINPYFWDLSKTASKKKQIQDP